MPNRGRGQPPAELPQGKPLPEHCRQRSPSTQGAVRGGTGRPGRCRVAGVDGPIDFDIEQLKASLRTVDHALIRLTPVGITERLLVDFRTNDSTGPGVCLLPDVHSLAERLKTIEQARPGFPVPERMHIITWPLRVAALERLGVLETIRDRLAQMDAFDALTELDEVHGRLLRLLRLERQEVRRAITGEGYHTLWPATAQA